MSYDKALAKAEFTHWSKSYDRSILQLLIFGRSRRALINKLKARYGDREFTLLDVGCGTGQFAESVHRHFPNARIFGLDLVAGMLQKGAHRWNQLAPRVTPIQADSERLPLATGTVDVVTCANSFHHYPNQQNAINEMHRVLRPGGRLMLLDGYRDAPWGWFIFDVCVTTVEGNVHHASRLRFRELLANAGFVDVEQKVHRGLAPFVFNEAKHRPQVIPAPHFAAVPAFENTIASVDAGY